MAWRARAPWKKYWRGAAGAHIRKGDILCIVDSHEAVLEIMGRFMQDYIENAKYLERTYGFVEHVGMDKIRAIVVDDSEAIAARAELLETRRVIGLWAARLTQ